VSIVFRRTVSVCLALIALATAALPGTISRSASAATSTAADTPGVFAVQLASVERVAQILRSLYPHARIVPDHASNTIVAFATATQIAQMRTIVQQLDVRNPTQLQTTAVVLKAMNPQALVPRLHALFPAARFSTAPNRTLLIAANATDLAQIKDLIASIDVAPVPAPSAALASEAVTLAQASPDDVAQTLRAQFRGVRASASGNTIVLSGPSDAVQAAKSLATELDKPPQQIAYTQIYRLRSVDAQSVANLLQQSFPTIRVTVEKDLNALTILAPPALQARIADGVQQLDGGTHVSAPRGGAPAVQQPGETSLPVQGANGETIEVANLRAAIPAVGATGGTTTATDIANAVQSTLARSAPSLHITVQPNSTQLILAGSADDVRLGKELIDRLDVTQKLVVLDTEILEVDESDAKNLGLLLQTPSGATVPGISTTISEVVPTPQPNFSAPPQFLGLLPFTRTGLSLGVQLNLLVSHGNARILADPRITTISGRTATIRAGDNITVVTQAGGGAGTVATTQLQTFQTGVSLDITPVINSGNFISILLHPVVNNLSGYSAGIPQISTRDTQTTVGMQADQTLIIGGLIEDSQTSTITKIPVLGDLPLIGGAFRNKQFSRQRNELVITVTPHIVTPGSPESTIGGPVSLAIPTPQALPTLAPGTLLPTPRPILSHSPAVIATIAPLPILTPTPVASAKPGGPTPAAFASANVFTYGSPPGNTFAAAEDPPTIYYATLSPTVLHANNTFNVAAITGSNISNVYLGSATGQLQLAHSGGPGFWQGSFVFSPQSVPAGATKIIYVLTATKEDGTSAHVTIPVNYAP
jgi:type II secretory pathway component GspD/PulD (secretin)